MGEKRSLTILAVAALVLVCTLLGTAAGALAGGVAGYVVGRRAAGAPRPVVQAPPRENRLSPPERVPLPDLPPLPPDWEFEWPEGSSALQAAARVARVLPGSPAERAGLQAGDLITAVDGQPLSARRDLASAIAPHRPGDRVELTLRRDDRELKMSVTLGEGRDSAGRAYLGVEYGMQFSVELGGRDAEPPGATSPDDTGA